MPIVLRLDDDEDARPDTIIHGNVLIYTTLLLLLSVESRGLIVEIIDRIIGVQSCILSPVHSLSLPHSLTCGRAPPIAISDMADSYT